MKRIVRFVLSEAGKIRAAVKRVPSVLMAAFVVAVVLMNVLANKSIDLPVSWLALDAGIVVAGFTFLVMDIIVKANGPKDATRVVVVGLLFNLFAAGVFAIVAAVPGQWGESFTFYEQAGVVNQALDNTIAGSWYVLLGSSIAFLVSAAVNSFVNHTIGKGIKHGAGSFKAFALRSYISTTIAQFIDNLIFALIVSLNFFGWSLLQCFMCALTGAVVELLFEVVLSPIGFRIVKAMEEKRATEKTHAA